MACGLPAWRGGRHGHADSVPSRRRPAGPVLHGRWISTAQRTASTTLWNCSTAGRLQTRPGPTWGPSLFAGPSRAGLETVPVLADRTLPAPYPPYKMICPAVMPPFTGCRRAGSFDGGPTILDPPEDPPVLVSYRSRSATTRTQ